MISASVVYFVNGFGDLVSVAEFVEIEFGVRMLVERHHTYMYLVWPDVELLDDIR